MPGTRKLGRETAHRTAMLRGLVTFFLENGKIETTVTRAKEVRAMAEKMITIAKQDNLHNKRLVMSFITKESVTNKLFTEIAPKYADRNGGYTRITKLGPRRGDAAEMAILELVEGKSSEKSSDLEIQAAASIGKTTFFSNAAARRKPVGASLRASFFCAKKRGQPLPSLSHSM